MKRFLFSCIAIALFLTPLTAMAQSPSEVLQTALNQVQDVLNDPAYAGQDMKDAQSDKLVAIIKSLFDFRLICRLTVANHWKNFSDPEQDTFVQAFEDLLQATYLHSMMRNTDVTTMVVGETELRPNKYEVQAEVTSAEQPEPLPMAFRMVFKDEEWKVYDVVVEGVSMVKNYRTQFQELLQTKSPAELTQVVRDKAAKAEAGDLDEHGNQ